MPHVAMAQDGSCASTSPNAFSVSAYRNECSIATARWKRSCTAGLHEFWKSTLPSWSLDCAWMSAGTTSIRATSDIARERCVFILPPVQFDRASPQRGRASTSAACFSTTVPLKKSGFTSPQKRTAFVNMKSRKSPSVSSSCSTSS